MSHKDDLRSDRAIAFEVRYHTANLAESSIFCRRLSFTRRSHDLGFAIDDITQLLELSQHPEKPCGNAHSIAECSVIETLADHALCEMEH